MPHGAWRAIGAAAINIRLRHVPNSIDTSGERGALVGEPDGTGDGSGLGAIVGKSTATS